MVSFLGIDAAILITVLRTAVIILIIATLFQMVLRFLRPARGIEEFK